MKLLVYANIRASIDVLEVNTYLVIPDIILPILLEEITKNWALPGITAATPYTKSFPFCKEFIIKTELLLQLINIKL